MSLRAQGRRYRRGSPRGDGDLGLSEGSDACSEPRHQPDPLDESSGSTGSGLMAIGGGGLGPIGVSLEPIRSSDYSEPESVMSPLRAN